MKTAADILRDHNIILDTSAAGRYHAATCPQCSASKGSKAHREAKVLGVNIDDKGVNWGCNHCGWTGGGYYDGKPNGDARNDDITTYDYEDESGSLLFQVCRGSDKRFWHRRPDGNGGWVKNLKDVRRVLYRLPEITEAIASNYTILVVEGEKDANAAWKISLPATCNSGGASQPGNKTKWRDEYSESLRNADVVILLDNDEPGYAHAEAVARSLAGLAKRVRVVTR